MSQSPQIQSRINDVAKDLAGGRERAEILRKYAKKWQIAERTIDRYLKPAKVIAASLSKKASKAADDVYVDRIRKAAESVVMSRIERLEILTSIAKCEFLNEVKKPAWNNQNKKFEIITVKEKPDHNGVIKAIAEMNKMTGDYEPVKIAQTDTEGNDIFKIEIIASKDY